MQTAMIMGLGYANTSAWPVAAARPGGPAGPFRGEGRAVPGEGPAQRLALSFFLPGRPATAPMAGATVSHRAMVTTIEVR